MSRLQPSLILGYDGCDEGIGGTPRRLYSRAGFWEQTRIQVAVINQANIKGIFRVLD